MALAAVAARVLLWAHGYNVERILRVLGSWAAEYADDSAAGCLIAWREGNCRPFMASGLRRSWCSSPLSTLPAIGHGSSVGLHLAERCGSGESTYCRLDLMTHHTHWPGCCPMLNRLGESRAFGNSGAVQSARRYLARIEFDSGAADCFHWPRPGLMALVASQSLPGRAGRVDAPREQRQKISCTRRDRWTRLLTDCGTSRGAAAISGRVFGVLLSTGPDGQRCRRLPRRADRRSLSVARDNHRPGDRQLDQGRERSDRELPGRGTRA